MQSLTTLFLFVIGLAVVWRRAGSRAGRLAGADLRDATLVERVSGAIITLPVFLFIMNALAIYPRHRFERRL